MRTWDGDAVWQRELAVVLNRSPAAIKAQWYTYHGNACLVCTCIRTEQCVFQPESSTTDKQHSLSARDFILPDLRDAARMQLLVALSRVAELDQVWGSGMTVLDARLVDLEASFWNKLLRERLQLVGLLNNEKLDDTVQDFGKMDLSTRAAASTGQIRSLGGFDMGDLEQDYKHSTPSGSRLNKAKRRHATNLITGIL